MTSAPNRKSNVRGLYAALYRWYRDQDWLGSLLVALNRNHVTIEQSRFYVGTHGADAQLRAEYWFDRYEKAERGFLKQYVDPRKPVIELGAGIGVISVLTNKQLDTPKKHVVLEANPRLLPTIEKNRALNNAVFEIQSKAYSVESDWITFQLGSVYTVSAVLSDKRKSDKLTNESIRVQGVSLRDLVTETGYTDITLICDIEGGEYSMFDQEMDVLSQHVKVLIVELHNLPGGPESVQRYIDLLSKNGFEHVEQSLHVHVFRSVNFGRAEGR